MVEKPDKNFIPNMNIIARHEAISFKLIKIALCKNLRNDPILFFGSFFSTKKKNIPYKHFLTKKYHRMKKYLLIATALAFTMCCKKTDTNSLDAELAKLPP